jgi:hypothetical protein
MFFAEIIVGQLANSPDIKTELRIGHIIVWNVTVSFFALKKSKNQKKKPR